MMWIERDDWWMAERTTMSAGSLLGQNMDYGRHKVRKGNNGSHQASITDESRSVESECVCSHMRGRLETRVMIVSPPACISPVHHGSGIDWNLNKGRQGQLLNGLMNGT